MKILLTFTLVLCLAARALAQADARPLPSFTVRDAHGVAVPSDGLAAAGRTTLLFVKPSCRSCDQLLGTLARLDMPTASSQLVLVIQAPMEQAAAMRSRELPVELQSVRWFADVDGSAWTAMGLKGVPVLVAVERSRIAWTYNGVPARTLLDSLLRTWLAPDGGAR